MEKTPDFQSKTCQYCFENLVQFLSEGKPKDPPVGFDDHEFPLFVTWQKNSMLRGCIGTFASNKLGQTLQQYSLVAAVKDRRFPPIAMQELNDSLRVEVSLLSNFEKIENPLGWEVGTHGIEVEFHGPVDSPQVGTIYRGTYLPQIAAEQGWNQLETLESLTRKAGHDGGYESVKECFILIRRYQSIKFGMDFKEFRNLSKQ